MDERAGVFLEGDADSDPLRQFESWVEAARREGLRAPEAMALATADRQGRPSARMVLLNAFDERGFVFYTGYVSRKAEELAANRHAALLFYWDALGRQVRIEGSVERVGREEAQAYFRTRPRPSRIAAAASRQSAVLAGRDELDARVAELEREYAGGDVPLPEHWGGYRLLPEVYEFWQHREDRLHDRLRYRRAADGWTIARLSP